MLYKSDKEIEKEFTEWYRNTHDVGSEPTSKWWLSLRHTDLEALVEYVEGKKIKFEKGADENMSGIIHGRGFNSAIFDISAYIKSLKEKR